jgi:hypothetical protein
MASDFVTAEAARGGRRHEICGDASFSRLRHKVNMRASRTQLHVWTDLGLPELLNVPESLFPHFSRPKQLQLRLLETKS